MGRPWKLAGLGLLANIPGDRKGVPGIEDTAVHPEYLPDYVADIKKVLAGLGLGVQPPVTEWGAMIYENREGLQKGFSKGTLAGFVRRPKAE